VAYTRDIKAGRATVELTTKDKMQRGLARARARLQAFGRDVQAMGTTLMAAGAGLLVPVAAALKTFSDIGDNVAKMARRTGLSVQAVQELGFAAKLAGTDVASLEKGIKRMQRNVYDAERGLSTSVDALGDLGLSLRDLQGLAPEDQFTLMAEQMSKIEDASRRAALAQVLFGRAGTMLMPMFEKGAAGVAALRKRFRELGVTLSAEDAKAAEEFTDTITDLWTAAKYGVALLGAALEPAVRDLISAAGDWLKEAADWIRNNRDLIVQYGKLAVKIGLWVGGIGAGLVVVGKLITSVGALVGVVKVLSAALVGLAANPFAAIAAGIGVVLVAYEMAVRHAANLSHEQERQLANADRERAADLAKLDRLKEIQAKHEKTSAEIAEATRLVEELEGKYGDLGLSVNKATGEVTGLAGAMEALAGAMEKVVQTQLESSLLQARQNLRELQKEREAAGKSLMTGLTTFATWAAGGDVDSDIRAMLERESEAARQIVDLEERLTDLRRGKTGALTGGAEAGKAGTVVSGAEETAERAAEAQAETEQRLLDRLVRLKIEAIEDEHERAVALLRQRYDEERRQLEAQNASAEAIHRLQMAQEQELANARAQHQRDLFAQIEADTRDWYAKQERHADAEQRLRDEIARQEIRNTKKGIEQREALLELERRIRFGDAEMDAERSLIDRLYDLKMQAIRAAEDVSSRISTSTRGTFGSFRAGASLAVASVAERTAKAAEQTARNTERLLEEARRGGIVFS